MYSNIGSSSSDEDAAQVREKPVKRPPKSLGEIPSTAKAPSTKSRCYPKSLSVLDMLRLGKVVDKKSTTVVTLHSFNMELMSWNKVPTTVEFVVDEEPLGTGAFRTASPELRGA